MSTGGVAVGDFDGDGRPDIFLASGLWEKTLCIPPDGGLEIRRRDRQTLGSMAGSSGR